MSKITKTQLNKLKIELEHEQALHSLSALRKLRGVKESFSDSSSPYGTPVDYTELYTYRGSPLRPIWTPETRIWRNTSVRNIQQFHIARNYSRFLVETNGNAQGIVNTAQNYIIHTGSTISLASPDEEDDAPPRLAARVKRLLTQFRKANNWYALELELMWRIIVDGEIFLRIFPDEDGITKVRFMEPSEVVPPMSENSDGPWAMGIYTPTDDYSRPEAYNFRNYITGTEEQVEAQYIVHYKTNCLSNMKRGLPGFFAVYDELYGSQKSRYANREGQKVRDSIAYVREFEATSAASVGLLQQQSITDVLHRTTPMGNTDVNIQQIDPGSVHDIPRGLKYTPPPESPNSEACANAVRMALMTAAARFCMPLWAVMGCNDDANFATALTEESPFVKSIGRWQKVIADIEDNVHTSVITIGAEQYLLPGDILEQVAVEIDFPEPQVRQRDKETARRLDLYKAKLMSGRRLCSEEGMDYEREQNLIASEPEPVQGGGPEGGPEANNTGSDSAGAQYKDETK